MDSYPTEQSTFFLRFVAAAQRTAGLAKSAGVAAVVVALGGYSQAYAISLGDIQVRSSIGQPLDAVVSVRAAPGETLRADCFRVEPLSGAGLPAVTNVRLSLSRQLSGGVALNIRGRDTLREPMSELILRVECPGTPTVTRTYLVLLDPPLDTDLREDVVAASPAAVAAEPPRANRNVVSDVSAPAPAVASAGPGIYSETPRVRVRSAYVATSDPIQPGSTYVVRRGDALSVIASRVAGRGDFTVWPIAEQILASNPHAFEQGDPNLLMVGASIAIPTLQNGYPAGVSASVGQTLQNAAALSPAAPSAPAPQAPRPEQAAASGREALRPAVGSVATPLPAMVLTQRLSSVSQERLAMRRAGKLQVLPAPTPEALTAGEPVPNQPEAPRESQPAAPAPAPVPASSAVDNEFRTETGFAGQLLMWIALLIGALLAGVAAAFGYRRFAQRRDEYDAEVRTRAEQYQSELDRNRQSRETHRPEDTIIVDELPALSAGVDHDVGSAEVAEGDIDMVLSAEQVEQQVEEHAPDLETVEEEALSEENEASSDDDFEFELFEEPNAIDLEMLARDYAETVNDASKTAEEEAGDKAMLEPSELGLANDGTAILTPGLDLELPPELTQSTRELIIDQGEIRAQPVSDEPVDSNATTSEALPQVQPGSMTMEIDAGLLALAGSGKDSEDEPAAAQAAASEDDTETPAPANESEEFYHLEASSVMPAGDLQFEADRDPDESKVLEFRHPVKTGTDDGAES